MILKNDLDTLVTFATDVANGSGVVSPGGASVTLPPEATVVYWTVEPGASPGSFEGPHFAVRDRYAYTISITEEAI